MAHQNNSGDLTLSIVGGFVLIAGLLIWKFSEALGLDFTTGARVISGLVAGLGLLALVWWQNGFGLFSVKSFWPVSLALVWMAFWPALNVWGAVGPAWAGTAGIDVELAWWAAWYTKAVVLLLILAGGWWLNTLTQDRYY